MVDQLAVEDCQQGTERVHLLAAINMLVGTGDTGKTELTHSFKYSEEIAHQPGTSAPPREESQGLGEAIFLSRSYSEKRDQEPRSGGQATTLTGNGPCALRAGH